VQNNVNRRLVHERQEPLVELKHVTFAHSCLFKDNAVTSADEELVRTIWVPNLFRLQEQKLGKMCICHDILLPTPLPLTLARVRSVTSADEFPMNLCPKVQKLGLFTEVPRI